MRTERIPCCRKRKANGALAWGGGEEASPQCGPQTCGGGGWGRGEGTRRPAGQRPGLLHPAGAIQPGACSPGPRARLPHGCCRVTGFSLGKPGLPRLFKQFILLYLHQLTVGSHTPPAEVCTSRPQLSPPPPSVLLPVVQFLDFTPHCGNINSGSHRGISTEVPPNTTPHLTQPFCFPGKTRGFEDIPGQ